ncbi:MAG: hypothetical protein ACFFCS_02075 [Candidatus Hodarchaeota archaeon]
MIEIQIDSAWSPLVKELMKSFLTAINLLDAQDARKQIAGLVELIRRDDDNAEIDDITRRDARIALEKIQQIDFQHPEEVLIESTNWKGNLDEIKRNIKRDLKLKNFDKIRKLVPKLLMLSEHNESESVRVKSIEILASISRKFPVYLEKYQTRFYRLIFDDNLDLAQHVAEILYNIDFHAFDSTNPKKVRKILIERFEERLINIWSDRNYERHFIKYTVHVENFTPQLIFSVILKVKKEPGFEIVKVDPDYPFKVESYDNSYTIDANVLQARSKKDITVYIDPVASEINIESRIIYKKFDGTSIEKENPEDVIDIKELVPKFMTSIEVSVGKCKDFFEVGAKLKDNRRFWIPEHIDLEHLKNTIHDIMVPGIVKVFEYNSDASLNPTEFFSEVYFYGQTEITKRKVALVSRISGEDRTLSMIIGTNDAVMSVGLYNEILARLKEFNLKELRCPRCLEVIDNGIEFCPWCTYKL